MKRLQNGEFELLVGEIAARAVADIAIMSVLIHTANIDRGTLKGLFSTVADQNVTEVQPFLRRLTARTVAKRKPRRIERPLPRRSRV